MSMKDLIEILSKYRPELEVLSIKFNRCTDNDVKFVLYDSDRPRVFDRAEPVQNKEIKA